MNFNMGSLNFWKGIAKKKSTFDGENKGLKMRREEALKP